MRLYKILNPNRNYKTIHYSNTPIFDNIGNLIWNNTSKISSFHYVWDEKNDSVNICDCPFIIGSIPVFSRSIYDKLFPLLNKDKCQIIQIKVEDEIYFIVNATILVGDILNKRKSKISYFSDGRIMDIEKYVFNIRKDIPDIFKIQQFQTYTFVSERFVSMIDKNVTGLKFEECQLNNVFSLFCKRNSK